MTAYAELHALSNFTFLRGASHPEELTETAAELGYSALAITDECSVSGTVRAHMTAKDCGLKKLIIGSEFRLSSGLKLVVLARNRDGYAQLCRLITTGRRAAEKGSYRLTADDFGSGLPDCFLLWVPGRQLTLMHDDAWILDAFHGRLWTAVELLADGLQRQRTERLRVLGDTLQLPLVACGDALFRTQLHRYVRASLSIKQALRSIRMVSVTCVRCRLFNLFTMRIYWRRASRLRMPSTFRWTKFVTNIRMSWFLSGKRPQPTCAS